MKDHYVIPIYGNAESIIGQGFFTDHYFITAGHVLTIDDNPYINYPQYSDGPVYLKELMLIYKGTPYIKDGKVNLNESSPADIAIFSFNGYSTWRLSDYVPDEGAELLNLCVFDNPRRPLLIDTAEVTLGIVLSEEKGIVMKERVGKYYACRINRRSTSSGSPFLIGNNIVGMMTNGNDEGICVCLSAKAIIEILKEKGDGV